MSLSFSLMNCIRKSGKKKKKVKNKGFCLLLPQHLKCITIENCVPPKVRKWQRFSFRSSVAESKNYLLNKSLNCNQERKCLSNRGHRINRLENLQTEMTQKIKEVTIIYSYWLQSGSQNLTHSNLVQYSILFSFKPNVNMFMLMLLFGHYVMSNSFVTP